MKKLRIVWILVGIAVVGFLVKFLLVPGPSDQALIQTALLDAIDAGKEGRPGSVIDLLSKQFTLNGEQTANMSQIAKFVRDSKPDVTVGSNLPTVNGETATIVSDVTIKLGFPVSSEITIKNVDMRFAKETATEWLIIPTKKWKLEAVTVPPESFANLVSPF